MDYKDKLRLAKEALESGSYDKETIEYIFPELKESEDEKIRKAMIKYFTNGKEYLSLTPYSREDYIAWLEKQGEQKTAEWLEDNAIEYWGTEAVDNGMMIVEFKKAMRL